MIQHLIGHFAGALHLATALLALLAGALVLRGSKGTRFHVWMGRTYFAAMLATNLSALTIFELFGRFGPFHVLALLSLLSVFAGLVPALRRRPGWVQRHARFVLGSWVGLCAAAVAEVSSHLLDLPFGPVVIGSSAVVIVTGVVWMRFYLTSRFHPA